MVHRTATIAILSCQFTSTVNSLPMLLPSYEAKGPIGHVHASFYVEAMFSHGRTEVPSRAGWSAGPLLGLKIASLRHPAAHKTVAGLIFYAHNGLKCHPMSSKVSSDTFIAHVIPKPWNHWFTQVKLIFDAHKLTFAPNI